MGGTGPNTGGGGSSGTKPVSGGSGTDNRHGHRGGHSHTAQGAPTGKPEPIPQTTPESFRPVVLTFASDEQNNWFLEPITRGIPSFPSTPTLPPGASYFLGLKGENESPIKFTHNEKVDNTLVYVGVYISNNGDIQETVRGKQRKGYKVGLLLSAGGGVFQLGPVYSILSLDKDGLPSMAIRINSPALFGSATISLKYPNKNAISLDTYFEGNGGLWKGSAGRTDPYKLNF